MVTGCSSVSATPARVPDSRRLLHKMAHGLEFLPLLKDKRFGPFLRRCHYLRQQ
jgi:hypothetical protein